MRRDVFYYGEKPNAHPREKFALNLRDARKQCTSDHFWIINEFCDYRGFDWDFDFEFLPDEDVWAENHNNVWPSTHQKDSGTWLCPKEYSSIVIYRSDVDPLRRHNVITDNWVFLDSVDKTKFDFSWHPDPTDPPYIYKWGCKFYPAQIKHVLEYHVKNATNVKYMKETVELLPNEDCWLEYYPVDRNHFDFTWRPNPLDPSFVYVWGNEHVPGTVAPTLEYHPPDSNRKRKHLPEILKLLPQPTAFDHLENSYGIDYTWVPNPSSPPYIYAWGNQWNKPEDKISIQYVVPGATEYKYMEERAIRKPCMDNWLIPDNIDVSNFDFSWEPSPADPPYIYEFGTQHQKTGGPQYIVPSANKKKYVDFQHAIALPNEDHWQLFEDIDVSNFDFSWHPDTTEEPYIYAWGNQWNDPEDKISVQYIVFGATKYKYMESKTIRKPCMDNWIIPDNIDVSNFDFSWEPSPAEDPYIYEFGTQHQKTGGPQYIVSGASKKKYIDFQYATALPSKDNWIVSENLDVSNFDFSWYPDATESPYIYEFGTQWQKTGGPQYIVSGAFKKKYIDFQKAIVLPSRDNWIIPENLDVSNFDFSWHPDTTEEPYIHEFGTQHQKTGGPQYVMTDATEKKYVDFQHAIALPNKDNWQLFEDIDVNNFDFSWHPDATVEPYIYAWGNQWNKPEDKISIQYIVFGATKYKYMVEQCIRKPCMDNWLIPDSIDVSNFDFSWEPSPAEDPYIYEFGTQHQKTGGPQYLVYGANKKKYIDSQHAIALPSKDNWLIPDNIDVSNFDFSWHPDATEDPYLYEFGTQWQKTGGPQYMVSGAFKKKYIGEIHAIAFVNMDNWLIPDNIDVSNFDFSWHPDATDDPYIYEFGTQWQKTGGPQYTMFDATEKKYIDSQHAIALPNKDNWQLFEDIDLSIFDFSWHPNATENPYVYAWGNQWNKPEDKISVQYIVPGASKYKYMEEPNMVRKPCMDNWLIPDNIDVSSFDFSWEPNPKDSAYIYEFATQWQKTGGPKYIVPGAHKKKYVDVLKATAIEIMDNWIIPENLNVSNFDFSWHPDATEEPYIHEFGTQWQKTGGPQYIVSGAFKKKYVDVQKAKILPCMDNWEIPNDIDPSLFDFSWHPDYTTPNYIYQFGTLLEDVHLKDGPRYITPDNNGQIVYMENTVNNSSIKYPKYYIKTTLENLIEEHKNEIFWALRENIDYTQFNFEWIPTKEQAFNINVFGSSESELTQTYFVNANFYYQGYRDKTYLEDKKIVEMNLTELFVKPDMFFVDKFNSKSDERFEKLKLKFPSLQKTRFLNTWVDTVTRCANRSSTELFWILNSELDYTNFDFDYYPNPWQMKMIHVFGTQWSHWGTTLMVNRESFAEDTKWIKIIEHLSNLNFVKDRIAIADTNIYDIYVVDHGNKETTTVVEQLINKASDKSVTTIKYTENYLLTFKNLLSQLPEKKDHYIWLCSSICDYSNFYFSYICDPFAREQLHVFPSDNQKLGDTFLVNVNKLRELIDNMTLLNEYNKINYNQTQTVNRLEPPTIITNYDSHVLSVMEDFDFPYAVFLSEDNKNLKVKDEEPISLWSNDTKDIIITSTGGTRIIVPKEAKNYVDTQLYDYPYIKKASRLVPSNVLDIIFLSNGEPNADENYENLLKLTHGLPNKVTRVEGINGRVAAYHKTAEISTTNWYFVVWGKLFVNPKFDWSWQPDRLQIPKNYIFHAKNPLNGLVYGHQAVVAYNKKLALSTKGNQLDFTMESPHQVVPILSGTANYNSDAWTTWRTAFRESIKLRYDNTEESKNRLKIWLTKADGEFADFSIQGANDAIEYFDSVDGEYSKLKLSYEWDWLREKFQKFD